MGSWASFRSWGSAVGTNLIFASVLGLWPSGVALKQSQTGWAGALCALRHSAAAWRKLLWLNRIFLGGKTGPLQLCELLVMSSGGDSDQGKIWSVTEHRGQRLSVQSKSTRGLLGGCLVFCSFSEPGGSSGLSSGLHPREVPQVFVSLRGGTSTGR